MRKQVLSAALFVSCVGGLLAAPPGLDLGSANNYKFIDIGASNLGWNSGPIAGNVLLGNGVTAKLSGGNNGGLSNNGILYYDNTATISGSLQNPVTKVLVPTTTTQDVATQAQNVSNYASSLAATQTFSTINGTKTITGNGGLNVIDADGIKNAKLTITGGPNDYFVFNISDAVDTNQPMILSGIDPSQLLFNLTGSGTVLFQTSGGNVLYGTYLATHGGKFQFSNLNLNGSLINIGGDVQFVSGSAISVPEPGTFAMVLLGVIGLGYSARRQLGLC